MFSPDQLNALLRNAVERLNGQDKACSRCNNGNNQENGNSKSKIEITPSQALVIAGILGGVLYVESVLVDKEQTVQIILEGSLKQKTELEKMMDKIGTMPFDEVVKAMLGRL